ncbi:MAG: AraC family transcriptional regulator [bacterium]
MPKTQKSSLNVRREIYLPGPESPHWLQSGKPAGGLLYLAWGHRDYGANPIPQRLHHGWTYMAVMSGNPSLQIGNRNHTAGPGQLIIAGPDIPFGWTDRRDASCSLLVWEWARRPQFQTPLHEGSCWLGKAAGDAFKEIEELHIKTRREIQQTDARSPRILESLHCLIDAAFERACGQPEDHGSRNAQRLHLAEAWMRRHLDIRAPARALAEYLGISTMTLHRLFREAVGVSTGQAFLDLKLNEASKMLEAGASVKETALSLGYCHPGDFTRAFKKRFGFTPTRKGNGTTTQGRSCD